MLVARPAKRTPQVPDDFADLLAAEVGVLATIGPDGRPQQSAVWFLAEGGQIATSLNTARQKTRNLRARPVADLLILDPATPYRYLEIRASAEIAPDDDDAFADRLGAKYGADLRAHDRPGERRVSVTLRPVRINAVDMRS